MMIIIGPALLASTRYQTNSLVLLRTRPFTQGRISRVQSTTQGHVQKRVGLVKNALFVQDVRAVEPPTRLPRHTYIISHFLPSSPLPLLLHIFFSPHNYPVSLLTPTLQLPLPPHQRIIIMNHANPPSLPFPSRPLLRQTLKERIGCHSPDRALTAPPALQTGLEGHERLLAAFGPCFLLLFSSFFLLSSLRLFALFSFLPTSTSFPALCFEASLLSSLLFASSVHPRVFSRSRIFSQSSFHLRVFPSSRPISSCFVEACFHFLSSSPRVFSPPSFSFSSFSCPLLAFHYEPLPTASLYRPEMSTTGWRISHRYPVFPLHFEPPPGVMEFGSWGVGLLFALGLLGFRAPGLLGFRPVVV